MKLKSRFSMAALSGLFCSSVYARSISLGSGGGGIFAKVGDFFQEIVDFLGGTGTLFVVFVAFCAGLALWIFAPKQAGTALGWVFRACIGAIALFSIGTLISWIQTF